MRVKRNYTLHFAAPIKDVFALFTPIHEQRWAPYWKPILIYSDTSTAEETGAVFTTQHPDEPISTWIIADYSAREHCIKYVKFMPEWLVTMIEIQCSGVLDIDVTISYTLTALSQQGQVKIQEFTEVYFCHLMEKWQYAISHLLVTGQSFDPH